MTTPAMRLDEATELVAHLEVGDSGVGGWPADGELALTGGDGQWWRGRLSATALDEAERVWAARASANGLTGEEATGVLRAAVDCDAAVYGLTVDWDRARVEADGSVARVAAAVRPLLDVMVGVTGLRASVILELVDMRPTYAVWQVASAARQLVSERELVVDDLDAPYVESMWNRARAMWWSMAASAGLSAAESLTLRMSISDVEAGSCGELEVSAAVR